MDWAKVLFDLYLLHLRKEGWPIGAQFPIQVLIKQLKDLVWHKNSEKTKIKRYILGLPDTTVFTNTLSLNIKHE